MSRLSDLANLQVARQAPAPPRDNVSMPAMPKPLPDLLPLDDDEIETLRELLDRVPEPLEPLDSSALDGYLCGVLLQPAAVPVAQWLRYVTDVEGRALPADFNADRLHALVLRRHAELRHAIGARQWFDPWVIQWDEQASPSETVLPWVAGFAAAMEAFPALMRIEDPELVEPLALLYLHFDADDLEDADALREVIDTLEPPSDLAEAVQDIVRSLMLIADVVQPRATPLPAPRRSRPSHEARRRRTK
jgi:uncharacterized protein